MGLMGKIGDKMGNAADRTNATVDKTAIKSKIGDERRNIVEQKEKLGEFYWTFYADGNKLDGKAMEFVKEIEASLKKIKEYEKELENVDKEKENKIAERESEREKKDAEEKKAREEKKKEKS